MCFSIFLCVNNSSTSYLFFLTLFITGIRKTKEKNKEHEAAIKRYKKSYMLASLYSLDCFIIAEVEDFKDLRTEFKQFEL